MSSHICFIYLIDETMSKMNDELVQFISGYFLWCQDINSCKDLIYYNAYNYHNWQYEAEDKKKKVYI